LVRLVEKVIVAKGLRGMIGRTVGCLIRLIEKLGW